MSVTVTTTTTISFGPYITEDQWNELYLKLYEAYDECGKNYLETYRQQIGSVLDHMIAHKPNT